MSTNTLVSDFIAEHDARQRTQQTRTPKEVHARMIEMTNAANGLRYEVARFGDIERQLKAVHEKMEPLVLKAKELNDLICERVSQASQPWADSRIHESEELVQKVQQLERENAEQCVLLGKGGERECALLGKVERLERENAALRRDVYLCPPTSENSYEGFKWADAFEEIEQDNAKLHNEVTALKHENLSLREARKPVAVPGLHGLVTWYADAQQLGEAFQREREKCIRFEEVMQSQGDEIRRLTVENDALREELKDAAMKGLGVALKAHAADLSDIQRENAALREDKERLDWLEASGEPETHEEAPHALVWCVFGETGQCSIRAAIDAARKEGQL